MLESSCAVLVRSDHRLANVDFLNLVDLVHQRVITSARALYDSIVAHLQIAGPRPNFVYKPCRRRPELR
ncbi:hypothetical protein [Paraburkholderia hospita]|jgi:hypothetical protein|uniref:hypothetical protein n=1 Tax=Paraburkholderia hospita TaxID=169430 RepID=UPI000271AEC2|nr:hypothetical protein [Paraburkholderia hospita]EUC12071.1 hypothetical protein PMI06_008850 [Burkholderia sp. BT03]SKC53492.1 hypothetical protein SAMN06266956_0597 [Paraburkholderia hospita]